MKRCTGCGAHMGFYGPHDYCSFGCKVRHQRDMRIAAHNAAIRCWSCGHAVDTPQHEMSCGASPRLDRTEEDQ